VVTFLGKLMVFAMRKRCLARLACFVSDIFVAEIGVILHQDNFAESVDSSAIGFLHEFAVSAFLPLFVWLSGPHWDQ
jgi:hypothetical protein